MLVVPNASKRIPSCVWSCLILAADLGSGRQGQNLLWKAQKDMSHGLSHKRQFKEKCHSAHMVANERTLLFPAYFLCPFWPVHIADMPAFRCPRTSWNFVKISFINSVLSAYSFVSNIWCLWALEDTKKFSLRIYSIKITFSGLQGMEREGGGGRAQVVFSWGKNC